MMRPRYKPETVWLARVEFYDLDTHRFIEKRVTARTQHGASAATLALIASTETPGVRVYKITFVEEYEPEDDTPLRPTHLRDGPA